MSPETYLFIFTKIASTEGFMVATMLMLMAFLWLKNTRLAVALFLSATGLILTLNVLKESLRVPRPSTALIEVSGYAFPSGHAAGAAFLAGVVVFLSRNLSTPLRYLIGVVAFLTALLIAGSRIAYQVHTPLQVVVGFCVGLFFAYVFTRVATRS